MVLHRHGERLYNGVKNLMNAHLNDFVLPSILTLDDNNLLSNLVRHWNDFSMSLVMIRDIVMYLDRVLHRHGERLYNGVKNLMNAHLNDFVHPSILTADDNNLMHNLVRHWNDFSVSLVMIRDIVMYLDRVYVLQQKNNEIPQSKILGIQLFRDIIFNNPTINARLKTELFKKIEYGRKCQNFEWASMKAVCDMLLSLSYENRIFFENEFENLFLQKTTEYYQILSKKLLAESNANEFVQKINNCLNDEKIWAL
uniref:Cullin N-terminal domain-containing protein n=1 Tax=Panagrolaimus sp. ES5 TaxID=591445 RepID=A0AC34G4F6_9BILA